MRTETMEVNKTKEETPVAIRVLSWVLRLTAAIILLQTLYFKFTGAPESVYIFTKVHAEPWGRIGSGVMELVASISLLTPPLTRLGALPAARASRGAVLR